MSSAADLAMTASGGAGDVRNPRTRKLRSAVWNDFTKEQRSDGSYVAICNHCKKQLTASSRSGTTHLKNHLAVCTNTKRVIKRKKLLVRRLLLKHGEAAGAVDDKDEAGDVEAGGVAVGVDSANFNQESSRRDLARMIIMHGYPFGIVQHAGFRTFVRNLQPQFKIASLEAIKADCLSIYENARLRLHEALEKLPARVSLTIDMWRSADERGYLCLTGHYIDDNWKLQKKILNFLPLELPLTAQEISKIIFQRLLEWNIVKKLATVVLENCSSGDAVAAELLGSLGLSASHLLNGVLSCTYSCGHLLNLVVQECLQQGHQITSKVRGAVQYVKSSQERLMKFQKTAKQFPGSQKPLSIDTQGNWSSTYEMFETFGQYQETFSRLAESDLEYTNILTPKDWIDVKTVTECLDVLYQALEKFAATRTPTANLYFNEVCGIHLLLKTWSRSQHPFAATLAKSMLVKFEQYWDLIWVLMSIASILDPRYKMKSVEYFFKQIYEDAYEAKMRIDNARNSFANLFNEYSAKSDYSSKNQAFFGYTGSNSGSNSSEYGNGAHPKSSSRITLSDTKRGLDQYLQETSSGLPSRSDLDMYLEEAVHPSKEGFEFDILAWWRYNAAKYPILSLMARDILAIPVSVVPLDNDARMLNQYLSSTDAVTVQCLVCAQDWIGHEPEDSLALVPASVISEGNVDDCLMPGSGD